MITLYGMLASGHVHKVMVALRRRNLPFRRVEVSQMAGETRRPEFLAVNPMGKVPALRLENGDVLTDSGAILYYLAEGTPFWPDGRRDQAEVLRWMFFEQYQHEPTLAVLRYLRNYTPDPAAHAARIASLEPGARFALGVMEQRLAGHDWLALDRPSLADDALYPYTATAPKSGIPLDGYPAIRAWIARMEGLPGAFPLGTDAAAVTEDFTTHFGL